MERPYCPKCQNPSIKSGKQRGRQRYKCKTCSYQFTQTAIRNHSLETKRMAIYLYLKRISMRSVAKVLGVSNFAVHTWVREQAEFLEDDRQRHYIEAVEVDGMWCYLGKKNPSSGYSERLTAQLESFLPSSVASVLLKP